MTLRITNHRGRTFTLTGSIPAYMKPATARELLEQSRTRRELHKVEKALREVLRVRVPA